MNLRFGENSIIEYSISLCVYSFKFLSICFFPHVFQRPQPHKSPKINRQKTGHITGLTCPIELSLRVLF